MCLHIEWLAKRVKLLGWRDFSSRLLIRTRPFRSNTFQFIYEHIRIRMFGIIGANAISFPFPYASSGYPLSLISIGIAMAANLPVARWQTTCCDICGPLSMHLSNGIWRFGERFHSCCDLVGPCIVIYYNWIVPYRIHIDAVPCVYEGT